MTNEDRRVKEGFQSEMKEKSFVIKKKGNHIGDGGGDHSIDLQKGGRKTCKSSAENSWGRIKALHPCARKKKAFF